MKSRFGLKKKVVSALSEAEQNQVKGGWTTSFGSCSENFICCGKRGKGSFTYCPTTADGCIPPRDSEGD